MQYVVYILLSILRYGSLKSIKHKWGGGFSASFSVLFILRTFFVFDGFFSPASLIDVSHMAWNGIQFKRVCRRVESVVYGYVVSALYFCTRCQTIQNRYECQIKFMSIAFMIHIFTFSIKRNIYCFVTLTRQATRRCSLLLQNFIKELAKF